MRRASWAARRTAGPTEFVVLLPPEPTPAGQRVSPTWTDTSCGRRPSSSATIIAIAVRKPVPMSCEPWKSSTEPSRWTFTSAPTPLLRANTYQLPLAMPMPRLRGPVVSPAFWLRRSQPMALAPASYWIRRTGLDSFFRLSSSGSMPSFSASSSMADSSANAPWEWPGARRGAAGPAFVKTSCSSTRQFGVFA